MREALLDKEAERGKVGKGARHIHNAPHRSSPLPPIITISTTPALQYTALAFTDSAPFIWFVVTPASILVRACVSFFFVVADVYLAFSPMVGCRQRASVLGRTSLNPPTPLSKVYLACLAAELQK